MHRTQGPRPSNLNGRPKPGNPEKPAPVEPEKIEFQRKTSHPRYLKLQKVLGENLIKLTPSEMESFCHDWFSLGFMWLWACEPEEWPMTRKEALGMIARAWMMMQKEMTEPYG